ncbi:PIN domain-containing protein [Cyanobacterium sp. Dongsha4]|uniref:PIN domain-containing protein n=1 Tax=Cyanobacterium sp. DS4 TaxID=2878255 RepID=UPI002E81EDA4|nr:PIN domain-containing protein [Cyanobacterium sp. Dongsha4]WVL02345.1 hypothetical protein Dongsha4_09235 [Cyanobacterium sp. Dongsha4]
MILVFELTTILSGCTRDWTEFSDKGECYLPEVVLQELNFLTQRAITPKDEKIAREFSRFFPDSGWQITSTMSSHPALSAKDGESISKKARLSIAIAESVYDLALRHSGQIIIFVSNDGNLKRELNQIGQTNLAIISSAQLKQWIRADETPQAVQDVMENLSYHQNNQVSSHNFPKTSKLRGISSSSGKTNNTKNSNSRKVGSEDSIFSIVKSGFLAVATLTITIGVAWYFIAPQSFWKTWEGIGLPPLEVKNK